MKNKILLFSLTILLISCKKETTAPPAPDLSNPNEPTLEQFFTNNAAVGQTFTLNAAATQSFNCSKGTRIVVPAGAFMTSTGLSVTGDLLFTVKELYSKKDFILNRIPTTTSSAVLNTGSSLHFKAVQSEELLIKPGKQISVKIPAGTSPSYSMQVLNDYVDLTSGNFYWQTLNWIPAPPVAEPENPINPYYYSFNSDSLHWINCSSYANFIAPLTGFTVTVHGNYNAKNTEIFVSYSGINSVAKLSGSSQSFISLHSVAVGTQATIVAISRINGNFYASYTPVTITSSLTQDINLSATTESEILSKLSTL